MPLLFCPPVAATLVSITGKNKGFLLVKLFVKLAKLVIDASSLDEL